MTLSSLSMQCLLAGSVSLALGAILIAIESLQLWSATKQENEYNQLRIRDCWWNLAGYAAIALISILKLVGIKKRNAFLLVPWLLAICGVTAFSIYVVGLNLITLPFAHLQFAFYGIAAIGIEILLLYPLFKLIGEIRREKVNAEQSHDKHVFVKF